MGWRTELSRTANEDLRRIYRHLANVQHTQFGYDLAAADAIATRRTTAIRRTADSLANAPHRGTLHHVGGRTYRHVTIDRAIYWFTLDEAAQTLRIEAIFFSGQNHLDRMFARLTDEGEAG